MGEGKVEGAEGGEGGRGGGGRGEGGRGGGQWWGRVRKREREGREPRKSAQDNGRHGGSVV